jgi:transposase
MDILVERCAALDVHQNTVVACVRLPSPTAAGSRNCAPQGHDRGAAGVGGLAGQLPGDLVGMEATGGYWKPVWQVLEDRVCCWLLGASHVRTLPGRKTDLGDAVWLCQLVEHGIVRPRSCQPGRSGSCATDWVAQGADPGARAQASRPASTARVGPARAPSGDGRR